MRDDVLELASAVASLKGENPNADASYLSIPGYSTINTDGEFKVKIRFASDKQDILAALASGGFRAGSFHQSQGSTTGWISYADLEALAGIAGVKEVSFAIPPTTNSDPFISEGDAILNVDDLRNFKGVDGTGVKVGVISDGADNWQYIMSFGELPQTITIDQVRPGRVNTNEGTAMMEIIYDLAPGAELYFSGPTDSDEMQDSIEWLVSQGCDVIVDDLTFFDQQFFQDGPVAQTAEAAVDGMTIGQTTYDPVVYVTAAGNYGLSHYQGEFNGDQNNYNIFAGAGWYPFPLTPDNMLFFTVYYN
jgi:hypothetical protein